MMSHTLPKSPDLDQLRKQAKELRREFLDADPKAVARVHAYFKEMAGGTPLSSSRAHLILAREHGFASWVKLLASVSETTRDPSQKVVRTADRVYISGLERMAWGEGKSNTYINSLRVAAKAFGDQVSYDELMAFSGAAFRVQLHQPIWCPSAADAGPGFNCTEVAVQLLGYEATSVHSNDQNREDTGAKIHASIDEGRPVLGIQLVGPADWGIAAGYDRKSGKLLCRSYFDKGREYSENTSWPFIVVFLEKRHERKDPWRLLPECLDRAVMLATTESFPADPNAPRYLSGFAALGAWAKQLRELDKTDEVIQANAFCYDSLIDCRRSATRFLEEACKYVPSTAAKDLRRASSEYGKAVGLLAERAGNAPFPWALGGQPWTLEQRRAEAETLEQVLAMERRAIAAIEAARKKLSES
jgi:hypothetical protein